MYLFQRFHLLVLSTRRATTHSIIATSPTLLTSNLLFTNRIKTPIKDHMILSSQTTAAEIKEVQEF